MPAHRREDLTDRRARFGIGRGAPRRGRNRGALRAHDLLAVDLDLGSAQLADIPRTGTVDRNLAIAPDIRGKPVAGDNETPAAGGESRQLMSVSGPGSGRTGRDDIARPEHRRARRRRQRQPFDRRRDEHVEQLQGFVVEQLLLRLAGNLSLFHGCTG